MRFIPIVLLSACAVSLAQETTAPPVGFSVQPPPKITPPNTNSEQQFPATEARQLNNGRSLQEMGGAITDQTVTVAGQDFYQSFSFFWREKELHERYAISIHERPSARLGNLVWVEYANRKVFQATLPPNRAAVREMGDQAAAMAYQNVVDTDVQKLLFRDEDLGPDEF